MITKRIEVYGRVQGVGFRWSSCREARQLGVNCWVRNRPDGSVEILAQGEDNAVKFLIEWASHGPADARVDRMEITDCHPEKLDGFSEQAHRQSKPAQGAK